MLAVGYATALDGLDADARDALEEHLARSDEDLIANEQERLLAAIAELGGEVAGP
jgi:hypothetical protein